MREIQSRSARDLRARARPYLAVSYAVACYKSKLVERSSFTRPAVEAGEKLGFLPGDLQTKVDPYLRPALRCAQELFGLETYAKLMEKGVIEVAPLAYMRGRTLSNAFVILDEAQNATREQMKMFLTRWAREARWLSRAIYADRPPRRKDERAGACRERPQGCG